MDDTKQAMSIPAAIIVAGMLIAGAVYFAQVAPKQLTASLPIASTQPTPRSASLNIRPISTEDHIRGSENAKITILEYSDLECPYCKIFHQTMLQALKDYPNDIRWVFRHAPIPQLHPNAPALANAAECASDQGKFWEFTDAVFAGPPSTSTPDVPISDFLLRHAKASGVADMNAFQSCVNANTFASKVQVDFDDGLQAGPQDFGTPFNMVITADGKKTQLGGGIPYAQFKAIIDPLL